MPSTRTCSNLCKSTWMWHLWSDTILGSRALCRPHLALWTPPQMVQRRLSGLELQLYFLPREGRSGDHPSCHCTNDLRYRNSRGIVEAGKFKVSFFLEALKKKRMISPAKREDNSFLWIDSFRDQICQRSVLRVVLNATWSVVLSILSNDSKDTMTSKAELACKDACMSSDSVVERWQPRE